MKYITLALALALSLTLSAITIGPWQNIRFSGKNAASQMLLRTELAQTNLVANKVVYDTGSGVAEYNLSLYDAAAHTYQAAIPVSTDRRYLGLKKKTSTGVTELIPVYHAGTGLPALSQLTKATDDALNDNSTNYYDIAAEYVAFTDTKIITGIQNRGGGFPTSVSFGTVYPSYMSVLADPNSDPSDPDVVVWALAYMNVPLGGISPGLFKITGTGTGDLVRIGNIETQIVSSSNLLVMSCNIADLMADADFAAWYNTASPRFGMQTIVNKTTVIPFATTTQDQSPGAIVYPRKIYADPTGTTIPWLNGGSFYLQDGEVYFAAEYLDAEGNFPLTAQIEVLGGNVYDLLPQSLDYSVTVPHRTADLTGILGEYDSGLARTVVSDDDINYHMGEWFPFTYILGILAPNELSIQIDGGLVNLNWEPVTLTLLGNPVTPDLYRVEASVTPDFASVIPVGSTPATNFSLPLSPDSNRNFFRVVAIKSTS